MVDGVLGLHGVPVPRGEFVVLSYFPTPVIVNLSPSMYSDEKILIPGAPTIDVEPAQIHILHQEAPIAEVATR